MSSIPKIVLTVLALIALYLILANGNAFNTALGTTTGSALKGIAVLQGRSTKVAE
jgi:hypothetical protein